MDGLFLCKWQLSGGEKQNVLLSEASGHVHKCFLQFTQISFAFETNMYVLPFSCYQLVDALFLGKWQLRGGKRQNGLLSEASGHVHKYYLQFGQISFSIYTNLFCI